MNSKKNNRRSLFYSVISLLLCVSMLLGTTLAWFSDSVSSTGNIIKTGRLKVEMHYADSLTGEWKDASEATIFNGNLWEPGYSDMKFIKVSNTGNLAFSYQMHILPAVQAVAGQANLADVIDVYIGAVGEDFVEPTAFSTDMPGLSKLGTLTEVMASEPMTGVLLPADGGRGTLPEGVYADTGDVTYCVVLHMQETAGNEYQDLDVGNNFTIQLVAAQYGYELDNFGGNYDADATYPDLKFPEMMDMDMGSAEITVDDENKLTAPVTLQGAVISATVPAGVLVEEGITELTLIVEEMDETTSNITLGEGEEMRSLDVHVAGVSANNTVPMIISLGAVAPEYLNQGNLNLAHVENGVTVPMTRVEDLAELDTHNEYYYDMMTGELTVAMATFSEVATVANMPNPWNGGFDYSWYTGEKTRSATGDYTIANADQLAAFGAIVGGMNGQTQNSFAGKTVKLIADINLGDDEDNNDPDKIFYPIGYYNSEGTYERTNKAITSGLRNFEGIFDGNGHTISNFYHNTWEMKGDHDWYTPEEQYYRDGMGLFGRVYGGTVMNLTVKNFKSDGEIATTGVIAAYADGATFENIAIFDCNPRVYNIGNGGIVGCVGWYAKEANLKTTFKNITVDNSNKISALWGSYDVACGGLVGQYYPTSGQSSAGTPKNGGIDMVNCHVSAQMDVYNDVCANYQYYAYRYTGMLIGSVRENVTDTETGRVYPKMDGITAENCTVHYGDWNDYYYCELVANSLASYTHDHQFSRLEQVAKVEGTTITPLKGESYTVPSSGRYNYVVVNGTHATENATCYHFVDGKVHNHDDYNGDGVEDYETVNGESIRVENNRHIYLEFNNLITGYGWGVTSKGLDDMVGVEILDKKLDGSSVDKFVGKDVNELAEGKEYKISQLFAAKADSAVVIKNDAVVVGITNEAQNNPVSAVFTKGTTWDQGTITFTGTGRIRITIQDYYFCNPTSIVVDIKAADDMTEVKRFDYQFLNVDKYLYRVGNMNEFSISSIFKLADGVSAEDIGNVTVAVTDAGGNALDVYTAGADAWDSGKINFKTNHADFTGPVKVTISDDNYSTPVTLNLEVVTATNHSATNAPSATSTSVVLLNDVSGSFSVSGGKTLYGNGFKVTLPTSYQAKYTAGFVGYVTMSGGNLDNVRIEGPVYPEMNIFQSQAQNSATNTEDYFFNSILINGGNNTISNSYISGSRTAVCIRGANSVEIEDTTLSGGAVANLQIEGANTVTLRNLTTQQKDEQDSYGKGVIAHGMGVLVGCGAEIAIEGELNQYNWLSHDQWKAIVGNYESQFPYFYTNSKYGDYQHQRDGKTYVNIAFIFGTDWNTEKLIVDNQTNKSIYKKMGDVTVQGYNGGVYSVANQGSVTDDMLNVPTYESEKFNPVAPEFKFINDANHDADDANNATDTYCVYDETTGIMSIGITGDSKTIDLSGVTITKDGTTLTHTAYLNGTKINGNSVTIKSADGTTQTLTFKAISNEVGYDKDGNPIAGSKEYTWTVKVEVATLANPAPVWNMNNTYQFVAKSSDCIYAYSSKNTGYGEAVPIFRGIKVNYYNKNGKLVELDLTGHTTIPHSDTQAIKQDFTITLDDGSKLTMNATGNYKSGVTSLYFTTYNNLVYAYPSDLKTNSWVRPKTNQYDFNITFTYQFTDPNGLSTEKISVNWYSVASDNVSKTVSWTEFDSAHAPKNTTCIAEGTLITMADGSKRAVENLRKGDFVMSFDHTTGEVVSREVLIVGKTYAEKYDKNIFVFDDGTELTTINEHGIFDLDLNQYVNIDFYDYHEYLGHRFVSVDANGNIGVKRLVDVKSTCESGYKYDIVTEQVLNYVAEDTLSVTHEVVDIVNSFAFGEEMLYDLEAMQADIEEYGLYTYEDFAAYCDREVFEQYNMAMMKVGAGKGLYTYEHIVYLLTEIALNENVQIID